MKNLFKFFSISILIFSASCFGNADNEKAKIHVILATDLHADDLEKSVALDLKRVENVIAQICKYTHMEVNKKLFLGDKSDPAMLLNYIENLEVQHNDVIWFYFSGHGYRTKINESDWPYLAFEKADVGLEYREIGHTLKAKGARLTLLTADCCNNVMKISHAPKVFCHKKKIPKANVQQGYQQLFLKAQGFLMVASADAEEYSYADDDDGSSFTVAFARSLHTLTSTSNDLTWKVVLKQTKKNLYKLTKDEKIGQNPIVVDDTE